MRHRGGVAGFCGMLTVLVLLPSFPLHAAAQATPAASQKDAASLANGSQLPAVDKKAADKKTADKTAQNKAQSAIASTEQARQAQIAADTQKLLVLAQELKIEVAKSNKDILSVDVVKRADEIEKLAKSLKERMETR